MTDPTIQKILDMIDSMVPEAAYAAELKDLRNEYYQNAVPLDLEFTQEEKRIMVDMVYINGKPFREKDVLAVLRCLNGGTGYRTGEHLKTLRGQYGERWPLLTWLSDCAVISIPDKTPPMVRRGPNYGILMAALNIEVFNG